MSKIQFLLLSAVLLYGPAGNVSGQALQLRVMSMNIKEGASLVSHETAPYAVLIRQCDPDVVCLQEVDHKTRRNGGKDWINALAIETGMFPFYCKSFDYQGGGYGVALLSKYPFFAARKIVSVISGAREPRATGWISLQLPSGAVVRVASTHLALESQEITVKNIADVNKHLLEDRLTPTLLVGDFNANADSEPIAYARLNWQEIGRGSGFTIPASSPNRQLDYVMGHPRSWQAVSYEIIARPDLSDHCFILADVRYDR